MAKSLKISILTTSFPVYEGIAVGVHVMEMARHLQQRGHSVKVLAPGHSNAPGKEVYNGIELERFNYWWPRKSQALAYGDGIPTNLKNSWMAKIQLPFFLLSFYLSAKRFCKGADIIHCHWSIAGLIGTFVKRSNKCPLVLSMHGAEVFVLGKNRILKYVLQRTDLLFNNSSFTQKAVEKNYPDVKGEIIHPGTDTNRFRPMKKEGLRESLDISDKDVFILNIGKFIPRKGQKYLIEAMAELKSEGSMNVQLRIGGRGYLKDELSKRIEENNLGECVKFLDYIPDEEIPFYFSEADIFVLPSIEDKRGDVEGLGVVLIEANACGTPVIGSNSGGIVDVIKNEHNGLLVDSENVSSLKNALKVLIENSEKRKVMGQQGIDRVKKLFSWKNAAEKMENSYLQLLKNE